MKNDEFDSAELVLCEKCGRKFLENRLEIHQGVCKNGNTRKSTTTKGASNNISLNKTSNDVFLQKLEKELKTTNDNSITNNGKPVTLICYLCSKEFGTHSLEIHLKTCRANYINNNPGKNPDNLQPGVLNQIILNAKSKQHLDIEKINEYNKIAERTFKDENYVSCPNCSRRFLPDRLELHLKGCKPKIDKSYKVGNNEGNLNTQKKNNLMMSMEVKNENLKIGINDKKNSAKELMTEKNKIPSKNSLKTDSEIIQSTSSGKNNNSTSSSFNNGVKPIFLVCFLCGREFGKHSVDIHIKTCFEKSNKNKKSDSPKSNKQKSLEIPEQLQSILNKVSNNEDVSVKEILNYNEIADNIFKENTMKQCLGCKRKFMPDRLEVHLRSCKSGQAEIEKIAYNNSGMVNRPKMQLCVLCGKEFGSLSLSIHQKNCKEVFEREQQNLPATKRKFAETILDKYNEASSTLKDGGKYDVDSINNNAYEIWSKEALVPCDNCGRTFLPDRLQVHLRSCKVKK